MCSYHKSWHLAAWNISLLVNLYFNFCTVLKPSVLLQELWWNEHHAQVCRKREAHATDPQIRLQVQYNLPRPKN